MKVGDLVRDTDLGDIGVILEVADRLIAILQHDTHVLQFVLLQQDYSIIPN